MIETTIGFTSNYKSTRDGARVPSIKSPGQPGDLPVDTALWQALETMSIDPHGATTTFLDRLRQYNGWSLEFTRKVDREYRRFLYLAARAGHPVTPSGIIDQAWHLHLIYTRHYWEVLCGRILGQPLHHEPSAGGTAQTAVFETQYDMTLASYRIHFGEEPPADVWPRSQSLTAQSVAKKVGPFIAIGLVLLYLKAHPIIIGVLAVMAVFAVFADTSAAAMKRHKNGGCGAAGSGGHGAAGDGGGGDGSGCGGGCGGCGGGG